MHLLLIEDQPRIAQNIRAHLQSQRFQVDVAPDGESALFLAETESYAAIILDWMLPDISGDNICKQLRKKGITTPILMLTAKSQLEDKVEAFACGADDYLTKPFALAELTARIQALIRRSKGITNPEVKIADLVVNLNTCQVTRNGKSISLAPKEFALLELLLTHRNQVINRMEILAHVWGETIDLLSNTVDVHIRYLRKKIDTGFTPPLIKTVKNRGYMLCAD